MSLVVDQTLPAGLSFEDKAKIDHATAIRALKRAAREFRRNEGAPPPEGGPTGKSVIFTEDLEEP